MVTWVSYGPNALLFRFGDSPGDECFARGIAIAAELERDPPPGLIEYVPAFTTVLLIFDSSAEPSSLAESLRRRLAGCVASTRAASAPIEIPVIYDGPDIDRVAERHQLSRDEVIELHAAPVYKVYMLGFSPGFPYLGDLDPRLHTPRLKSPRPRVAAGSVAIGGAHTGIYSVASPGGWNIVGHTSTKLFDPRRGDGEEMFLLRQGARVRFVAVSK